MEADDIIEAQLQRVLATPPRGPDGRPDERVRADAAQALSDLQAQRATRTARRGRSDGPPGSEGDLGVPGSWRSLAPRGATGLAPGGSAYWAALGTRLWLVGIKEIR